jgi:molybdopterin-containing oxidoreductase family membrane subunit
MLLSVLLVLTGAYCAYTMEHEGHHITGMNNSIVWGLPHVFAIALILTASGALNGATLSSVFGIKSYSPTARLSVVLSICLLIGGLIVLVLDLGRPDRLVIAMTTYNFRSIFSWNIFLYTGFVAVGVLYLATLLERSLQRYTTSVGALALFWRIVLTTGTGSIFGFLVGRSALDSAILAPLFIALSLVMGSALFALVISLVAQWQRQTSSGGDEIRRSLMRLLLWSVLAVLYFSAIHHVTNLYIAEHRQDEANVLQGAFALIFWVGHLVLIVVAVVLVFALRRQDTPMRALLWHLLCGAAIVACALMLYTVIIGSQNMPQLLFPDKIVTASSFGDAGIASYRPTRWEWGLGVGGVALSLLMLGLILRVLPIAAIPVNNKVDG